MFELEGTRALVTGAGGGIGRSIATKLALAGAAVAAADVKEEGVKETAEMINRAGGKALAIIASVSVDADARRMIGEAVDFLGGLDILVNNAGVSSASFIEGVSDGDIDRVLSVNLVGAMRATRAAVPRLKDSGRGRIINISSVEGIRGSGLLPVYSSSKAGLIGLTRSNAVELARFGVTVNALCPGPIETEMLAPLIANPAHKEKMIKGVPAKRLGKPDEVAAAVVFLSSMEAAFITGNVMVIDGGMTVKAL